MESGEGTHARNERAASAGDLHAEDDDGLFDGFVRKPVAAAELARTIERALDARRRQRENAADGAAA